MLIIINLYIGINKAVTHNPVPKFWGIYPLIVISGSMEPAIMPGDVVVIREQSPDKYEIGDVVTYLDGNISYTHRIVGEEDGLFVLKGDNNNVTDDKVEATQLIGKVIIRIPKIGEAILFLKTLPGLLLMLSLLVLLVYGEEIWWKILDRGCRMMKYTKLVELFIILALFSFHFVSPTISRFSSEYAGSDGTLIAKWDFQVGITPGALSASNMDFNLFEGVGTIGPDETTTGAKSFYISPGESDVDVEYEIYMKANGSLEFNTENGEKYLPLVFRVDSDQDDWVTLEDLEDGFSSVATGSAVSLSGKVIEVEWLWNPSKYIVNSTEDAVDDYNNDILNSISGSAISINLEFKVEGRQKKPEKQ